MKNILRTIVVLSCFSISGCSSADNLENNKGNSMNKFSEMKNWCIGRYTFQIPKESELIGGNDRYGSFNIESETFVPISKFNNDINKLLKEYLVEGNFIKDQTKVELNGDIITKIIWGHSTYAEGRLPVEVFAFVYDKPKKILFKIKGTYSKEYEEKSIASIKNLVNNLSGRKNDKIPDMIGVCIQNGFIKDSGELFKYSNQSLGFNIKNLPSLRIAIQTEATSEKLDNLIDRTTKNIKKTSIAASVFSSIKTIRKGEKSQNSIPSINGYNVVPLIRPLNSVL